MTKYPLYEFLAAGGGCNESCRSMCGGRPEVDPSSAAWKGRF